MSNITFSCQKLQGVNKAGILKPDSDGYYTVVGGGFNITNESNNYYPFNKYLENCFKRSSAFMRRITRGHLRGEFNHPAPWAGMTEAAWFARLREIKLERAAMHISDVTLDFNNYKSHLGETMVACILKIRPVKNEFGEQLLDSLNNPKEDTCFSVRTLTLDTPNGLNWRKDVYEMVTWDYVPEPGVRNATKYHSPGLESFQEPNSGPAVMASGQDYAFSPQTIRDVLYTAKHVDNNGTGLEAIAGDVEPLENILKAFGMESSKNSPVLRPAHLRW